MYSSNCIHSYSNLLQFMKQISETGASLTSQRGILILKILFIYYAIIILLTFLSM